MSPMPIKTAIKVIDQSPFFEGLDEEAKDILRAGAKLKAFIDGQVLTKEGDVSKDVFLINRGEVLVKSRMGEEDVILAILKEGQIVGEVSAAMNVPRTSTVTALGMVEAVLIPMDVLEQVMSRYPEVRSRLQEKVAERANETIKKIHKEHS